MHEYEPDVADFLLGSMSCITLTILKITKLLSLPDESRLPTKVPLRRCPGLECSRGQGRCVATSLLCDKTVDCLGAEDELGCPATKMRAQARVATEALTLGPRTEEDRASVTQNPKLRISNEINAFNLSQHDNETLYNAYITNSKILEGFKLLNESGILQNMTGLVNIKKDLAPMLHNDTRLDIVRKIFNETGLLNETRPINVTRMLNATRSLMQFTTPLPTLPLSSSNDQDNEVIPPGEMEIPEDKDGILLPEDTKELPPEDVNQTMHRIMTEGELKIDYMKILWYLYTTGDEKTL